MARTIIDLSIYLENDVVSDPEILPLSGFTVGSSQ
jgi:hypothetical protein